jgi:hypothetical protein
MTSEREIRDIAAGLAEEVDSWLRGDLTRRTFQRAARLGLLSPGMPGNARLGYSGGPTRGGADG